ncbi:hypothetical protein [Pectinatus sottacetonis]|uniref:hypothetical protein n=1 Tax=Pectinatus sottacetonis TaxID=1002795 RepID=UPI0018C711D2|nr:hypothetical protein [Pectinatus sottacetonis]
MVIEQKFPVKQVDKEFGICIDTLRSWLKKSGLNPVTENRSNTLNKKVYNFESQIRILNKKLDYNRLSCAVEFVIPMHSYFSECLLLL